MGKLTDSQMIVLAAAVAREDGAASLPAKMNRAAASKVGSSLVARKLMREMRAKPDMPVWREDEDARAYSLVITVAGRKAMGVDDEAKPGNMASSLPRGSGEGAKSDKTVLTVKGRSSRKAATESVAGQGTAFREGSKQALVVKMLSAKSGATLPAMEDATGWLPHTMRAALTGLRKRGFVLTRDRQPGKNSVYKIADSAAAASA